MNNVSVTLLVSLLLGILSSTITVFIVRIITLKRLLYDHRCYRYIDEITFANIFQILPSTTITLNQLLLFCNVKRNKLDNDIEFFL